MDWGCLPEPFPCSRKKLLRMKTTVLAPPTVPMSVPSPAPIDEASSQCPQYKGVPDFQRVQITGDYASGVGTSWLLPFHTGHPMVPACPSAVPSGKGVCTSCTAQSVPHKHLRVPCCIPGDPELNSLAGAVGCCTFPWDSQRRPGRAGCAPSVTSSLLAHSSESVHIQGSRKG